MVSTHSATEATKEYEQFAAANILDNSSRVCVELIFCLKRGCQCWSVRADKIDWVIKGMAAEGQQAYSSLDKVFLTANPTRYSLRSSALQLSRKKVKPFFLNDT